jgi:type IV secretory pathway VirB2 component (pilin)
LYLYTHYSLKRRIPLSNNEVTFLLSLMTSSLNNLCLRVSAAAVTFMIAPPAMAQLFGPVPDVGAGNADIRSTVLNIIKKVLTFMALVAVVFIVIAGIRLVISQGEEAEKDKAKKTIFFVIIGLIVILLAQAIVDFIATQIATSTTN